MDKQSWKNKSCFLTEREVEKKYWLSTSRLQQLRWQRKPPSFYKIGRSILKK
ncbi:MAG: hypothetical protein HN745_23340 [Deltaproteobacteria bacterium]|nr:hypothetical protein [Deltaproteobacteria bacterium]